MVPILLLPLLPLSPQADTHPCRPFSLPLSHSRPAPLGLPRGCWHRWLRLGLGLVGGAWRCIGSGAGATGGAAGVAAAAASVRFSNLMKDAAICSWVAPAVPSCCCCCCARGICGCCCTCWSCFGCDAAVTFVWRCKSRDAMASSNWF